MRLLLSGDDIFVPNGRVYLEKTRETNRGESVNACAFVVKKNDAIRVEVMA